MKIICIGWNYPKHNSELSAQKPSEPTVFLKPDSAILRENKPFFIPDFSNEIHHEVELVLRISRLGKNIEKRFAHRYYDALALGVDFTARDLQRDLRAAGEPWEKCKAFDNSAVVSGFLPIEEFEKTAISFHLKKNGETVQSGNSAEMIFDFDEIVAYVSQFFTLKIGDLIFTGTPDGVGKVEIDDVLEGFIGEKEMFKFKVK